VDESDDQGQIPALAGLAEVAAILGVSRQRVRELSVRDDMFPLPVAELAGGAIYLKAMIEEYSKRWDRRPGHPGKHQAQVLDELKRILKDRTDINQQILRMIYHNLRRHDLAADPLTPRGQTLSRAIELARREVGDFEPQYDRSYFLPQPPDSRYLRVHAQCCSLTKVNNPPP
jgi:hypothetical protein